MKQLRRSSAFTFAKEHPWLTVLLGAVILGSVFLITLYIMGNRYWSEYTRSSNEYYIVTKQETQKAFKENTESKMNALQLRYDSAKDICEVSVLHSWQTIFDAVESKQNDCKDKLTKMGSFGEKLRTVSDHLNGQKQIAEVLTSMKLAAEIKDDAYTSVADKCAKVEEKIIQLKVAGSLAETKTVTEERVSAVCVSWEELQAAHAEKSRIKYEAAVSKIATEYNALSTISKVSSDNLEELIKALQVQFKESFP